MLGRTWPNKPVKFPLQFSWRRKSYTAHPLPRPCQTRTGQYSGTVVLHWGFLEESLGHRRELKRDVWMHRKVLQKINKINNKIIIEYLNQKVVIKTHVEYFETSLPCQWKRHRKATSQTSVKYCCILDGLEPMEVCCLGLRISWLEIKNGKNGY